MSQWNYDGGEKAALQRLWGRTAYGRHSSRTLLHELYQPLTMDRDALFRYSLQMNSKPFKERSLERVSVLAPLVFDMMFVFRRREKMDYFPLYLIFSFVQVTSLQAAYYRRSGI